MDFYITILGCSAALPTATRQCSSQVVNIDGYNLLIDCGEGTQNQIRRYRIKLQSMSDIFISHLHGDHFFGLPGLLSSMHLCGRTEPVNIYAPKVNLQIKLKLNFWLKQLVKLNLLKLLKQLKLEKKKSQLK